MDLDEYYSDKLKEALKGSTPKKWWPENLYGHVPNYPPPLPDTNPFNLIEGNENKIY